MLRGTQVLRCLPRTTNARFTGVGGLPCAGEPANSRFGFVEGEPGKTTSRDW